MKQTKVIKIDTNTEHILTFVKKTHYGFQFYLDDKKKDVWFMTDNLLKKYFKKLTE